MVTVLASSVALLAIAATFMIFRSRDGATVRVSLRPVEYRTPHPFTKSVTMIDADEARAFARKVRDEGGRGGREADRGGRIDLAATPGDHRGLYGSRRTPVCDKVALVSYLRADGGAARTWAALMRVRANRIQAAVDALTPVVLSHDTAVTNHEYRGGRAQPLQDVLEAGTAVLVDAHGSPRVQCSCGNPLRPPTTDGRDVQIVGERWDGFRSDQVVSVEATSHPVDRLPSTDVDTGEATTVGTGGTVTLDGLLVADGKGVHVVSEDGTRRTTVIDHPVAAVVDDGAGGLIYNELGPTDDDGEPTDRWASAERTEKQAVIWHLPAGSDDPIVLIPSSSPATSWAAVGATGRLDGDRVLAYLRIRKADGGGETGDLVVRHLDTGKEDVAVDDAVAPGTWIGSVSIGVDHVGIARGSRGHVKWSIRDSRLEPVEAPCEDIERRVEETTCPGSEGALTAGSSTDRLALFSDQHSNFATGASAFTVTYLGSGDRAPWFVETTPLYDEMVVDAWNGRGLLSLLPAHDPAEGPARIVDLGTGKSRELPIRGLVRFLRAPIVRPAPPGRPSRPPSPRRAPSTPPAMSRTGPTEFTIEFTHPGWGRVRMIVQGQRDGCAVNGPVNFRIIDAAGRERYRYDNELMLEFAPAGADTSPAGADTYCVSDDVAFPVDAAGTIFLDYNPGRYNGVIALRPTVEGFEDFGTLPASDDYQGRFYSASPVDRDGDGVFEVEQRENDCIPDCAGGTVTTTRWQLHGDDFVQIG